MPALLSRILQFDAVRIVMLAVLYIVLGRAALLLSIPPGYAMAIYPPAGLALAAVLIGGLRLIPGVVIGSLGLNLWIGYESGQGFSQTGCLVAALIALGAGFQALFGRSVLKHIVGYPTALDTNSAIFSFMLLGGPFSCLINTSIGVATLYGFGIIPSTQLLSNWITWWVGDALGVLIITPICLILFGQPAKIWRSRRVNVLLPLLITLVVVVTAFLFVRQWEQNQFRIEFRDTAQRLANSLQTRLDYHIEVQKSVVSLYVSTDVVSKQQFERFVAQPVTSYSALQAIEWAPRIMQDQRAGWEQQIRQSGHPGFAITEKQSDQLVNAAIRPEYFPVLFVAPTLGNERAIGFDLGSDWVRRQTINDARDLGIPAASEPLALVQGGNGSYASLLVSALYDKKMKSTTRSERRLAMTGVVLTVLRLGDVLDTLLQEEDRQNIMFALRDGNPAGTAPAYFNTFGQSQVTPIFATALNFAGRELQFTAHPAEAYYLLHKSWAAWGAMVGGMLFTCLVGMYLLFVSGRSYGVEALVDRRTRQLHESEHRLHAILDNAAEGILTFDTAGVVVLANRAARQLLGYGGDSLLGQPFWLLFRDANGALQLERTAPGTDSGHIFREVLAQRMDGSQFDVGLSLAKMQSDEQMLHIVIIHDLTEKKRVDRLKGEFVSAVSHELRTPLTSIRGSLGLLVGGAIGSIPEAAHKLLVLANENAERLANLINDILDFERLEYGGMLFRMEPHNVLELLTKAVEINGGYAQKFSIHLVLHPPKDPSWQILVDGNRMMQVITNLISNAIKFSLPNGEVEISVELANGEVLIWVIDHGIGISHAFQKEIFKKFSQADGSERRKYAGTGLGLSLSKSMVEKMNGRIGFDSVEGKGARFFVAFPLSHTPGTPSEKQP